MIEKYLTKDYLTEICKNIGMYPEVTETLLGADGNARHAPV